MRRHVMAVALIIGFFIFGCQSQKSSSIPQLKFEIKEFSLTHEDSKYTGEGIVAPIGDPNIVKQPYLVFVKCELIKGGNEINKANDIKSIIVINGIGKFTTSDVDDKKHKLERPEYKFEIIGYIPFLTLPDKSDKDSKLSFELKEFRVKSGESDPKIAEMDKLTKQLLVLMGSSMNYKFYVADGIIGAVGNAELVKKPYAVLVKIEKIKGFRGAGDNAENSLEYVPIINGLGKIRVFDFGWDKDENKEIVSPEYKVDILGYRQIET